MTGAALVTGAAGGIGGAVVDVLLRAGWGVAATDLAPEALDARAASRGEAERERLLVRALDVRDEQAWQEAMDAAVARFGAVDVVMNVAGYLKPGPVWDAPLAEVDRHMGVNFRGVVLGTQVAARHMVPRRGGHVVNVASLAALGPVPGLGLYSASKVAMRAFSLVAWQELKAHGVCVSLVCPDAVQTPMLDLQKGDRHAALTFSGGHIFTAEEVAHRLVHEVLRDRPMEVWWPPRRGALIKIADVVPALGLRLSEPLRRRGRARQHEITK